MRTEAEFGPTTAISPQFLPIDATHFLVLNAATQATGTASLCTSYPLYATILTVNTVAGIVTAGSTKALPGVNASVYTTPNLYASLIALDSTRFVLLHSDCVGNANMGVGGSSQGFAEILTIDLAGDSLTLGTPYTFDPGWATFISAGQVDSGHILVAYQGGGNVGYANLLSVNLASTTPFSAPSPQTFGTTGQAHRMASLTGNRFLDVYKGAGGYATGRVITVTITPTVSFSLGTAYTLNSEDVYASGTLFLLDSTNLLDIYSLGSNGTYNGRAMILNVSPTDVVTTTAALASFPGPATFDVKALSAGPFGAGHYVASYSASGVGEAFSLSASSSPATITLGAATICPPGGCPQVAGYIDSGHFLGYRIASDTRLAASVVDVQCP
jgi:hypothetical protein